MPMLGLSTLPLSMSRKLISSLSFPHLCDSVIYGGTRSLPKNSSFNVLTLINRTAARVDGTRCWCVEGDGAGRRRALHGNFSSSPFYPTDWASSCGTTANSEQNTSQ